MAIAVLFEFTGSLEEDDLDFRDPVMRLIGEWMAVLGWQTAEAGEDHGCVTLHCTRGDVRLGFMCAQLAASEILLQLHPSYLPGLIGWLRGKPASATDEDQFAVAVALHERMSLHPEFHNLRWCWNGFPVWLAWFRRCRAA